jgi:hypothetical protein
MSEFMNTLRATSIDAAVNEIIKKKNSNNGRLPQGSMRQILSDLRSTGIVTDRDHLNYMVAKRNATKPTVPLAVADNNTVPVTDINTNTEEVDISTITNSDVPTATDESTKKRGRRVGTSISALFTNKQRKIECINEISEIFATEQKESCNRTSNSYLDNLITKKWEEYGLDSSDTVSKDTIRSRVKRGNLIIQHRGTPPVLPEKVEKVIAETVLAMQQIRQPLSVSETIEYANSLIKGSEFEEQINKFKLQRQIPLDPNPLGIGWWRGFSKRYKEILVTKKGEKFAKNRSDWSTERNIRQMYDEIYNNMVEAGIAVRLDDKLWMNSSSNTVVNEEKQLCSEFDLDPEKPLGLQCDSKLIHPQYLLFFDETGCNTNQKKDGHNGGEKFVCARGTTPKQMVSTSDKHFTVLGLTAATGEPVLCVIIFASDKEGVPANWATGIDIMVTPHFDEEGEIDLTDEVNFGTGKYFPSGPTCLFRGKNVPCLPLSSPSGSITGELLVAILSYLDSLKIYERQEGDPVPFLVVDGHDSRLSPVFVDYITNPAHQ